MDQNDAQLNGNALTKEGNVPISEGGAPVKVKRAKKLPVEVWDSKRRELNQKRRQRNQERKRAKNEHSRREQAAALCHLSPSELQALEDARRQRDVARHLAQEAAVDAALGGGLRVVVDCAFNATASDKESRSLSKQLEICCAMNRKAPAPVALTFTSFCGPFLEQCGRMGAHGWRANKHSGHTLEVFRADEVVVLSPDAPDPLLELDPHKVYVVGGLIDRSVQKNVTLKYAQTSGLAAVRLPFTEYSEQLGLGKGTAKSPVLNVNDVVAALLEFNANGDWVSALDKALPARKRRDSSDPSRRKATRTRSPEFEAHGTKSRSCEEGGGVSDGNREEAGTQQGKCGEAGVVDMCKT